MISIDIIKTFIDQYLYGDLQKLLDFDLKRLKKDNIFGCPGRRFDPDDSNIMRAIYCVVFDDVWKNLSPENCGEGKLRGDTMNSSATFFSYPWDDKFTPRWNPPVELTDKIKAFQKTFHTVGNMTILPDKRIGEWSINKHRGCHDVWHDYEDRFLNALYKVLTNASDCDKDLQELVELNKIDFAPFYGEAGWKRFIDGNMLEYYVDDSYKPIVLSKGYTWWQGGYINRDRYFTEAYRYISDSSRIIEDRGKRIIGILKDKLSE